MGKSSDSSRSDLSGSARELLHQAQNQWLDLVKSCVLKFRCFDNLPEAYGFTVRDEPERGPEMRSRYWLEFTNRLREKDAGLGAEFAKLVERHARVVSASAGAIAAAASSSAGRGSADTWLEECKRHLQDIRDFQERVQCAQ